jgi:invasion protein IalB
VQVWIDEGQRAKHAITTADQNGSYAIVPLDQAMIGSMKKGTILNVLVKSASGDEVTFQLSLNGFTAALERV